LIQDQFQLQSQPLLPLLLLMLKLPRLILRLLLLILRLLMLMFLLLLLMFCVCTRLAQHDTACAGGASVPCSPAMRRTVITHLFVKHQNHVETALDVVRHLADAALKLLSASHVRGGGSLTQMLHGVRSSRREHAPPASRSGPARLSASPSCPAGGHGVSAGSRQWPRSAPSQSLRAPPS
jgi:hypothetical protein